MIAARQKINKNSRKYCFEIFGYDFMIDEFLQPWLIEVNTNPCLEESSALLKQLVPRMLDDAFKLTIDLLYPPLKGDELPVNDEDQVVISNEQRFPVDGYQDDDNMWGYRFYRFRPPVKKSQ